MSTGMAGQALFQLGELLRINMKTFYVIFLIIFVPWIITAQELDKDLETNLLRYPESVAYDVTKDRYLVSSQETGSIIEINDDGSQKNFVSGFQIIIGLTLSNNVLYAVCNNIVRGFSIQSRKMVFEYSVTNAKKLNDIAVYKDSLLYVSDVIGNQIFAININKRTDTVLASININGPNGLLLDEEKNRLLMVFWKENSDLQSIDLSSGNVYTVKELGLSFCDGITKDDLGNFYISEWETGSIHKFDSDFSNDEIIYSNELAPADIFYNEYKNEIVIPLVYGHKLDLLPIKN